MFIVFQARQDSRLGYFSHALPLGAMRTTLSVGDQGRGAVSVYAAILTPEVRETRAADGNVNLRAERK